MGWSDFTVVWGDLPSDVDKVIVYSEHSGSKVVLVSNEPLSSPYLDQANLAASSSSHHAIERGTEPSFFVYLSPGLTKDWDNGREITTKIQLWRGLIKLPGPDDFEYFARFLRPQRQAAAQPDQSASASTATATDTKPEIVDEPVDLRPVGRLAKLDISNGALVYRFTSFNPGSEEILKLKRDFEYRPRILELARVRLEEERESRISYYVEVRLQANDGIDSHHITEIENAVSSLQGDMKKCVGIGTCSRYGDIYPTELDDRAGEPSNDLPAVNTQILYVDSQNNGLDGSQEAVIFFDLLNIDYELERLFIVNARKFDLHFTVGVYEIDNAGNPTDRRAENAVSLSFTVSMTETEGKLFYLDIPGIGVKLRKYEDAEGKKSDQKSHQWLESTLTHDSQTGNWELLRKGSYNWLEPDNGTHTADALMCLDFGTSLSSLSHLSFQKGFSKPQHTLVDLGDTHAAPFAGMTAGVRLCDSKTSPVEKKDTAASDRKKLVIEFKQTPADKRGISKPLFPGGKQQEFLDPKNEICTPDHEPIYFKDDDGYQKAMFRTELGAVSDCRPDIKREDFFRDALKVLLFPSVYSDAKKLITGISAEQTILLMVSMPEAPPVHVEERYRLAAETFLSTLAYEHLTVRTISEAKATAQLILAHKSKHDLLAERARHDRSRISVFDFGAGTLDIAVIDFDSGCMIDDKEDYESEILVAPVTRVSQSIRMAGHELDEAILKDIEAALDKLYKFCSYDRRAYLDPRGFLPFGKGKLKVIRAYKENTDFAKDEGLELFPPAGIGDTPACDLEEIATVSLKDGTVRYFASTTDMAVWRVSIEWACMKNLDAYLRYIGDVVIAGAWYAGNQTANIDHHLAVVAGRGSIFPPLLKTIKNKLHELAGEKDIRIMDYLDIYEELRQNSSLETLMGQCGNAVQFAKSAVSAGALLSQMEHYRNNQFVVPLQQENSCTFLDGHNFAVIDGDINGDNVTFDIVRNIHLISKEGGDNITVANKTMYLVCAPAGLALAWKELDAADKAFLLDNLNASINKVPPQKFDLNESDQVQFELDRNGETVLAKNQVGGIDCRLPLWPSNTS